MFLIGDENVMKFVNCPYMLEIGQAGIRVVDDNEIDLAVFEKVGAFQGGAVGDFDVYVGVAQVELF